MTHPLTNALAMRTAAAEACTDIIKKYDVMKPDGVTYEPMRVQRAAKGMVSIAREDILALPLEAGHAALLAEAVRLPEIAALIDALTEIAAKDDAGDYLYHAPGPYARIAKSALLALETP